MNQYYELSNDIKGENLEEDILKNIKDYSDNLQNYFQDSNDTNYEKSLESEQKLIDDTNSLKNSINEEKISINQIGESCKNYNNEFNKNFEIINAQIEGNSKIKDQLATKKKTLELGKERYNYTSHLLWFFFLINVIMIIILVSLLK